MSEWLSFIQAAEVRANVDAICGKGDFKEEFRMMTKQAELKKQAYASKLKSRALSVLKQDKEKALQAGAFTTGIALFFCICGRRWGLV